MREFNNAEHRWQSDEAGYSGMVVSWLGVLDNQSADSTSPVMNTQAKAASVTSMRFWNSREVQAMIGLYADLQRVSMHHLNLIQPDCADIAVASRISEEFCKLLRRSFIEGEILRDVPEYRHTMTQLMLHNLRLPLQFFFGDGEVLSLGWQPDTSGHAPSWAVSALRRFQKIVALVVKLVQEQWDGGLDPLFKCYDLVLWKNTSTHSKATLRDLFAQLSKALELSHCHEQFEVVLHFALSSMKGALATAERVDGNVPEAKQLALNKESWRNAALVAGVTHDVSLMKDHLVRFFVYDKNSTPNERDIAVIDMLMKRGDCSQQFLRDAVSIIRYGPKERSDFAVRQVVTTTTGEAKVQMIPTRDCLEIQALWVELRSKRHQCNHTTRKDQGQKKSDKGKKLHGRAALKRRQDRAFELIRTRPYENGMTSIFGGPLKKFRSTLEKAETEWSDKFKDIFAKYKRWRNVYHRKRVAQPIAKRYSDATKSVRLRKEKEVAKQQHRRLVKSHLRESVMTEMQLARVRLTSDCGLKEAEVPAPWTVAKQLISADVLCIKGLAGASNFKCGGCESETLPDVMIGAVLLGKRVCTPRYIRCVANGELSEVPIGALPISLKFEPLTKRRTVHICLQRSFEDAKPTMMMFLDHACSLQGSKWTICKASLGQYDAWIAKRKDHEAAAARAAKVVTLKLSVKGRGKDKGKNATASAENDAQFRLIDSMGALHQLIRDHVWVDKLRSTMGKYY